MDLERRDRGRDSVIEQAVADSETSSATEDDHSTSRDIGQEYRLDTSDAGEFLSVASSFNL